MLRAQPERHAALHAAGTADVRDPPACDTNADMHAFTTYMDWLTEQWNDPHTTTHRFPAISTLTGNAAKGRLVFQQKCAVCHRLDGPGRRWGGRTRSIRRRERQRRAGAMRHGTKFSLDTFL